MILHLPDETVQKAFDALQSEAHWAAKLVYERTNRERKTLLARLERESNGKNQRERETYALTHPHLKALDERMDEAEAAYFKARDERDSADTIIRAWQTLRSDQRALERVR